LELPSCCKRVNVQVVIKDDIGSTTGVTEFVTKFGPIA